MVLKGFFKAAEQTGRRVPLYLSPQCGACKLHETVDSPKMQVDGDGAKKILVIGEGPGEQEDREGRPFVGATGQLLQRTLDDFGVDLRRDCWVINSVRCRPWEWADKHRTKKKNRAPTDKEVAYCRPYATGDGTRYGDIKKLNPEVIILLGGVAVKSVIGWLWKEDPGGVNRWAGWRIPCQSLNAWLCPAWHPSYVSREEDSRVVSLMWRQHLEAACALARRGRPWKKPPPDYERRVTVELVPRQAAYLVREITRMGRPAAVDIETTTLKPDGPHAEIYTCAVSNGTATVSFPWQGEARQAALDFLRSPVPKVGWNGSFELRWFLAKEGVKVRRWAWDGMQASHVLDNRPGVTSVKYQAFALLGMDSYSDHIKPYLEAKTPNAPNRIKELDLRKLLLYGGLDALLELEVGRRQARLLGVEWEDRE